MLSREDNELMCRVGRGTPMGELLRQYWLPCLPARELPAPDGPPKKVRLLGEDLVAFRDTRARSGCSRPTALIAAPRSSSAGTRRAGSAVCTTAGSST